jgi:hypothetical protein
MLIEKGFPKEALPCKGCREIDGHCPSPSLGGKQCGIYKCAKNQKFNFCFECTKSSLNSLLSK